ncbi:MAG: hypothetical protein AAB554_03750 [Patescibacteria group bacterium]
MTLTDVLQRKIAALPGPVQDYLYSEAAGDLNDKIITRNKLAEDQEPALFGLLREIFVKELAMKDLGSEVKKRFGFDELRSRQLAVDIAGFRLLPLDKWLGDVDGHIRSLGGNPAQYPEFRVRIEHRTPEEAALDIVEESVTSVAEPRTQVRLRGVVESFLAGVRTEDQTKEVLTRPEKIGGLGFNPQDAARVLEEAREETRSVIIDREVSAATAKASAAPAPVKKKQDDFSTIKPEDEAEIEKFKQVVLPAKGVEKADETAKRIEASIDGIYLASGLRTEDEAMAKRVKSVIANRVRDVRDQMETLETMVQPKELGGLGLSQDAARALLNAIQAKLREVHDAHAVQTMTEKTEWVEKERTQKAENAELEQKSAETDLERLYSSIVSKSKKAKQNAPVAPAVVIAAVPAVSALTPPPNLPIATTNPVPPELRAPAIVPLPPPATAPAPSPVLPPLTLVRPTPGVAVMPQVQGTADAPKPRMEDVKPMARLTGPVEELRAIAIVDFRRLSKDPSEACLKIKDKIDILAEQSYTRRTEAIAAWRASEPVRTYLELMGEGLNGTPLKDAVAARQAAKKPYLTPEEFQAVAAFSRQLRY